MEDIVVVSKLKLIGNLKKNVILPNFLKPCHLRLMKKKNMCYMIKQPLHEGMSDSFMKNKIGTKQDCFWNSPL